MLLTGTPQDGPRWLDRSTPPHIVTLILMTGLATLNMNIILPSLPNLALHFDRDYAVVQLAVSAYLAMTALLQLVIGPLSDRYGRRPVSLVCAVIFLFATLGCIWAPNFEAFLVFRLLQTAIASSIAISRAIVRDMVPPEQAASKIAYVTMGMAVAPMIGPVIGGFLELWFGWHAVFWMIFVFGLLVTWMLWADLGETNLTPSTSFRDQFRAYPELASSRRFWGYSGTAACATGGFFAFLGGGPWVASHVLGLTSAELGFWFGTIAVGYMAGNYISGRFASQIGMNRMMVIGSLIAICSPVLNILLFWTGMVSAPGFFGCMLLIGLGNGISLPSANAGIVSVRPHLAGSASGLGGAMMIGGGAALSAVAGALLRPETGAWPMLIIMLLSLIASFLFALDVVRVARRKGDLVR